MKSQSQITGPNAGGPRQFPVRMLLASCVCQFWCSLSEAVKASPHRNSTGHGFASGEVYVVGLRPRPDDGFRRCRIGSTASMRLKYHAEPRRARRGRPIAHLFPLGTQRRSLTRPESMAVAHSPRISGSACISPLSERIEAPRLPGLLRFLLGDSRHWEANQTEQRTGSSGHAEWRCERRGRLAPVADLPRPR